MKHHRVEVIDRSYAAILAAKSPAERIAIMDSMHRHARVFLAACVAELFPDLSEEGLRRECLRRILGDGTVADLEARG